FIALLAAMAPMLGLLGTVSGMIETFQSLTEFGNSDPKLLSQGISKALITTQAGLLVALPLLLLHYPLKRRAQALSLNMEQQSALLLALNLERGDEHVTR
ncbi:MotA/TolQ/ExbB proton channel family protein, partial [Shewanella schlegeliana]